jgi:hypothetical protein
MFLSILKLGRIPVANKLLWFGIGISRVKRFPLWDKQRKELLDSAGIFGCELISETNTDKVA